VTFIFLIICLLKVLKFHFVDVDDEMFHDVELHFERIFFIQGIQKSDLDEFAGDVLSRRMALRNHNLPSCLL
jgi:hypothetical protein